MKRIWQDPDARDFVVQSLSFIGLITLVISGLRGLVP